MKMIDKVEKVIGWIIAALSLFGLYIYFTGSRNINTGEILNQNKKIKELEKVVKKAKENSNITEDNLNKVREETDKILKEQEEKHEKIKIDSNTADNIINDVINS
jgi:uncharacterized membrane protein (DUF106 family)